jgi:hypothetical protein
MEQEWVTLWKINVERFTVMVITVNSRFTVMKKDDGGTRFDKSSVEWKSTSRINLHICAHLVMFEEGLQTINQNKRDDFIS